MCVLRRERSGSLARRRSWTFPVVCACVRCSIAEERCVVCVGSVARPYLLRARMQCALLVNCHGFRSMLSSRATVLEMVSEANLSSSLEYGQRKKSRWLRSIVPRFAGRAARSSFSGRDFENGRAFFFFLHSAWHGRAVSRPCRVRP